MTNVLHVKFLQPVDINLDELFCKKNQVNRSSPTSGRESMKARVPPSRVLSFSAHFNLRKVLDATACSFVLHKPLLVVSMA